MKPISALLIDDEQYARDVLRTLLERFCPQVQVQGEAENIQDGIRMIHCCRPDLVLLDVALGEENGFALLDRLPTVFFQLIFTTAHREFASQAFRYQATDYLLKPIQSDQLIAAVERAGRLRRIDQIEQQLLALRKTLMATQEEKIVVPTLGGLHLVSIRSIVHVAGSANYSTFHLHNGEKIVVSKPLKHYEDQLPAATFFRVHQSHLVNTRFIKRINTSEGYTVELTTGSRIPLAKGRKKSLLATL